MKLEVTPIAGSLGAVVKGMRLPIADADHARALREIVHDRLVVFFPGQDLNATGLEQLANDLGGTCATPFIEPVPGHPHVTRILREPHEPNNFGNRWHTDQSFSARPPAYTLLFAVDVPSVGGDTVWANQYLAYNLLTPGLRKTLRSLKAVHSARETYGVGGYYEQTSADRTMRIATSIEAHEEQVHPVVVAHPETGRPMLFVNQVYTTRFSGWSVEESAPLLNFLYRIAATENITCRYQWHPGTLAVWDNRATLHNALNDYQGQRREMYRVVVGGTPLTEYLEGAY